MRTAALRKRLTAWTDAGLLAPEQALRIEAWEAAHAGAGAARRGAWALGVLGALAVAVGVISVVASNWRDIPDGVKLAVGTALPLLALWGAARADGERRAGVRGVLLVLYDGLVLAHIALVAQVFHLSGAPWRPFAVTAAFALPAAAVARQALPTDAFLAAALTALGLGLEQLGWLDHAERDLRFALAFAAVGLACLFAARALERVHAGASRAAARWGLALAAFVSVWGAGLWSTERLRPQYVGWALPVGVCVLAAVLVAQRLRGPARVTVTLAVVLGLALLVGPALVPAWNPTLRQVVGFVLFCATWLAVAAAAAELGEGAAVNVASLLVAGRVFALYLELVEDLLTTGLGLIGTGLVFCAIAWGWWRVRRAVPLQGTQGGAA